MRLLSIATFFFLLIIFSLIPQEKVSAQAQSRDEVLAVYRKDLDEYRRLEDQNAIAYQQYSNLRTLASQEEAVLAMRNLLMVRADVLLHYFDLLRIQLETNPGADSGKKIAVVQSIQVLQDDLRSHRNRSEIATDRLKADQEAEYLEKQEKRMVIISDQAQSLDLIGRQTNALAAIDIVKKDVDAAIESSDRSETEKVEKRRGSDELGRSMQAIMIKIQEATTYYDKSVATSTSPDNYSAISGIVASSYIQILRSHDFLKELIQ